MHRTGVLSIDRLSSASHYRKLKATHHAFIRTIESYSTYLARQAPRWLFGYRLDYFSASKCAFEYICHLRTLIKYLLLTTLNWICSFRGALFANDLTHMTVHQASELPDIAIATIHFTRIQSSESSQARSQCLYLRYMSRKQSTVTRNNNNHCCYALKVHANCLVYTFLLNEY